MGMTRRLLLKSLALVTAAPMTLSEFTAVAEATSTKPQGEFKLSYPEFRHFLFFNVGDVAVCPGDRLNVNHGTTLGPDRGSLVQRVNRYRVFDVLKCVTVVGICVQGLIVRKDDKLVLDKESFICIEDDADKRYYGQLHEMEQLQKQSNRGKGNGFM